MQGPLPTQSDLDLENLKVALNEAAILAVTDAAGVIRYANDRFCKISGYSRAELIGQTHRLIKSEVHPPQFYQSLWQTISSGKVWSGQLCNRAKDGRLYWVDTVIVPFFDKNNKPYQYVAVRFEVTEKKEVEFKLQSLLDSTFEGLMIYDLAGEVIEVNRTATELLGKTREQLIGASVDSVFGGELQPFEIGNRRLILKNASGSKARHFEIANKPYTHAGHRAFLVCLVDVTEKDLLEAQTLQQDRLATAGLMASSLAHEIGTPLGVIRGRAEMVAMSLSGDEPTSQQMKKSMDVIVQQIDRVSKLIQSMLNLTRSKSSAHLELIEVGPLIDDVFDLMNHELRKNHIDVSVEAESGVKVLTAPHAFFQVFLNLVVNSVHAIKQRQEVDKNLAGQINVSIRIADDKALIAVRDNGTGIEEANLNKLFTPFFTTKEIGLGTGLGLATALKIVQSWGGGISVKTRFGEFAEFTLALKTST